jgi:hypothetical protein
MRRSLIVILAFVLASSAIIVLTGAITKGIYAQQLVRAGDDLAWFRREFHLSKAELERVRRLHEGYLPKCREMCDRIAAKKNELHAALHLGKGLVPDVEQKLAEIGILRSQCQARMLQHFYEVSLVLPPEHGRRYLEEMHHLTLGFHDQFERSMSGNPTGPHGTH